VRKDNGGPRLEDRRDVRLKDLGERFIGQEERDVRRSLRGLGRRLRGEPVRYRRAPASSRGPGADRDPPARVAEAQRLRARLMGRSR
jgi:hypothetical protein